jgi:histidinol-phosphate aminotransferase
MSIRNLARPELRSLQPYSAAAQVKDTTRLNANEVPWPNSADHFLRPLNRYPEVRPLELHAALSKRFGCETQNLLATRGTSEAIDLLIRTFCRPGIDNIVTTAPTFSMYQHYATVQGATVREVVTLPDEDFVIDVDVILETCDESTRIVFICSPNNPTGTTFSRAQLLRLLKLRGERSMVVVDEAYIEFSTEESVVGLLAEFNNLVVLRTLSKALAFAGARCGAVIAASEAIDILDAVQAPYAFATPVVECVLEALEEERMAAIDSGVQKIVIERERVISALRQFTVVKKIWPSAANFFLLQLDEVEALLQQSSNDKVLIRYFGGELSDCVRITVGSPAENDRLLAVFQATEDNLR